MPKRKFLQITLESELSKKTAKIYFEKSEDVIEFVEVLGDLMVGAAKAGVLADRERNSKKGPYGDFFV